LKKVRILIINNPLTALFMDAQLSEVEKEQNDTSTIIFYEKRQLDLGYCANSEQCEEENRQYSLLLFKHKYPIYNPPEIYYRYSSFANLINDCWEIKQEQIDNKLRMTEFLRSIQLLGVNVAEIWHGNTFWQKYLSLDYPSATTVRFDHGLSETLMYFSSNERTLVNYIYSKLNLRKVLNYIMGLYFITPPVDAVSDIHFTLNSLNINAALGYEKTKLLAPERVGNSITFSIKGETELSHGSTMAVILLDNIKPWAKSPLEHKEYFAAFETMLLTQVASKFKTLGITTLVFKPKHWHEEYAREEINDFSRLSELFELKYFPDYYDNLPLEYFLRLLNPRVIVGNLSSGLYYAKHLLPLVETYTYDGWFIDYTIIKFGATYPDFHRMRPILFGSQVKYFESLNPVSL
jgi:hypothetical protein